MSAESTISSLLCDGLMGKSTDRRFRADTALESALLLASPSHRKSGCGPSEPAVLPTVLSKRVVASTHCRRGRRRKKTWRSCEQYIVFHFLCIWISREYLCRRRRHLAPWSKRSHRRETAQRCSSARPSCVTVDQSVNVTPGSFRNRFRGFHFGVERLRQHNAAAAPPP